jgi:hypothetical protein
MVGVVGFEPTSPAGTGFTGRLRYQFRNHSLVGREGFEPPVFTLWDRVYSPTLNHRLSSLPMW